MKPLLLVLTFLSLTTIVRGQNIFQKTYGTSDYEEIWGLDLTYDGGYILGGYSGFGNAYFMRLNSLGDTVWTRKVITGGFDLAYPIIQTKDSGFIAGGRESDFGAGGMDMLLIKLDANGNHQWTKSIGGSDNETVNSIYQTFDGGYILAGNTYSFSAGLNDFYIVKTDVSGNITWSKSVGGASNDNAYSIIQTTDSGYIAVGLSSSAGAGSTDVLATKLDKNGNVSWMKTYGGTGDDRANSVQQTTDGGYIIAGVTNSFGAGGYDFYLLAIDSSGNLSWNKTFGGAGAEWAYSAQITSDNGYVLAGYATSFGAGSYDYYIVKTNSTGDTLWTKTFGGATSDYATVIKQTPDNGYAIIGYKEIQQGFPFADYDFYFVKTDGNGDGLCNQNHTNTHVGVPTTSVDDSLLTISSGGSVSSTSPTVVSGTTVTTFCSGVTTQLIEPTNSEFHLYPNPFHYSALLDFDNSKNRNCTLTIFDVQGRLMQTMTDITTDRVEIIKQNLTSGLYFFQLRTEKQIIANGKLIIE